MRLENNRFAFWWQKQFFVWVSFLLVILIMIVIFPRQKFDDYTTTHSLTRYYKEKDYKRSVALIKAIYDRDLVEVKRLLAKRLEVNCPNHSEFDWESSDELPQFPIEAACAVGNYKIVEVLIDSGAVVSNELLSITTSVFHEDDLAIVKLLIEHGADPSKEKELALTAAEMGWIHGEASFAGKRVVDFPETVEIFKYLEANGMDIYVVDSYAKNVVVSVASTNNVPLLAYLIEEKQMDINSASSSKTALGMASGSNKVNSVRYLVEHGADQTIKNSDGLTPLEVAQKRGYEEIVQILSEHE